MKYEKMLEETVKAITKLERKNNREIESLLSKLEAYAKENGFSPAYARKRAMIMVKATRNHNGK